MIHVDTREKPPIPADLGSRLGCRSVVDCPDLSRHTLKAADFALFDQDGHSLGVEHKRPLDWLASLGDKQKNGETRIWNEIHKMQEWYTHPLILRTGALKYDSLQQTLGAMHRATGWNAKAARLLEWTVAREVPVIQLDSIEEMLDLLAYLNKRAKTGCAIPGLGIIKHGADATRSGEVSDRLAQGSRPEGDYRAEPDLRSDRLPT